MKKSKIAPLVGGTALPTSRRDWGDDALGNLSRDIYDIVRTKRSTATPSTKTNSLGQFEEIVLLATLRLTGNGYGTSIKELVEGASGRSISIGALYATLDRLERKGFISSRQGEATPERGGRAKRYFKVEAAGVQALNDAGEVRQKLAAGLEVRWA